MTRSFALAAGGAAAILEEALDLFSRMASEVYRWHRRRRTRSHLEGLDDRMLADIGLSRSDVMTMRFVRHRG